mmetsp:Transcript_34873/g.62768  ORF Transcript_34873/g.62768 Transcript_34873/m.62768 type:complete len:113 (+) Transcript_34873:508-846(+)
MKLATVILLLAGLSVTSSYGGGRGGLRGRPWSNSPSKRRYLKAKDKASLGRSVAPSEASPGETKASGKGVMKSPTMMSSPLTHSAKGAEKTEILGSEKEETPKTTKGSSRRW